MILPVWLLLLFFFCKLGSTNSSRHSHIKDSEMPEANRFILTGTDFRINYQTRWDITEGTLLKGRCNRRKFLTRLCVRTEDSTGAPQPHSCGLIPDTGKPPTPLCPREGKVFLISIIMVISKPNLATWDALIVSEDQMINFDGHRQQKRVQ